MEQLNQWLEYKLFTLGDGEFKVRNLAIILLILISAWILRYSVKRFFGKPSEQNLNPRYLVGWTLRSLIYLGTLIAVLVSLPSDKLFTISKNSVRVFDLINIVIIFILARVAVWYLKRWFISAGISRTVSEDEGRRIAISQILSYIVYVVAILLALTSLKIDINLIIASTAGLFVGVGLALQHTIDDFVSGVVILFDRTLEVGDMVVVHSLGLEGKVKEIRIRTTIIETLDNITVVVPNSKITKSNVINWSFNDSATRFIINIGVAYGSDVQLVRELLIRCANDQEQVLEKPLPQVRFMDFGESSLDFELLFWVDKKEEIYEIRSDLRYKIEAAFRENKVNIPFPQRTVHLVSDPKEKSKNA